MMDKRMKANTTEKHFTFIELTNMKEVIKKKKSHAFGKDIYLIGVDDNKTKYWLEAPKWDCGWYWGFGYIETYTNNNSPQNSKDKDSHQHWEGLLLQKEKLHIIGYGEQKTYSDMHPYQISKTLEGERIPYYYYHEKYYHNPYDNPFFDKVTFDKKEGWELGELFAQFYFFKDCADKFNRGNANISPDSILHLELNWQKPKLVKEINEVIIPTINNRIIEILTP